MKVNMLLAIKRRAIANKISVDKQKLNDIHCYAEKIIDEIESKYKVNEEHILKQAITILDIALSD